MEKGTQLKKDTTANLRTRPHPLAKEAESFHPTNEHLRIELATVGDAGSQFPMIKQSTETASTSGQRNESSQDKVVKGRGSEAGTRAEHVKLDPEILNHLPFWRRSLSEIAQSVELERLKSEDTICRLRRQSKSRPLIHTEAP